MLFLDQYEVILASQSPRRQELLGGLDIPFTVRVIPDLDESYPLGLQGSDISEYLARKKASAYEALLAEGNRMIITADTIVWLKGKVYEKPKDVDSAKQMLRELSGKTHEVITGVSVMTKEKREVFSSVSRVTFANLSEAEITYYVEKYRPMDKAGSYGVQEWIGYVGVEHIDGSYFNVMGLPIQRLYKVLQTF